MKAGDGIETENSMLMIEAILRPNRLEAVKAALVQKGIVGATAEDVRGFGKQMGHGPRYRGPKMDAGFVPKVSIRVCVSEKDKAAAVEALWRQFRSSGGRPAG